MYSYVLLNLLKNRQTFFKFDKQRKEGKKVNVCMMHAFNVNNYLYCS